MINRIRQQLCTISIFHRIAIGNSIVIVIGAVGGTLVTRLLTGHAADVWLIGLFATVGTCLSVLINGILINISLRPLRQLRRVADQITSGEANSQSIRISDSDPDIAQLSAALFKLLNQLEERNLQLRALSAQVIHAQEEERKRIALSLHDDTGQALSMLIISLERLADRLPEDRAEIGQKLEKARDLAAQTLGELRKIISGLRPTILDDLGLAPAIRWYARSNLEEAGVQIHFAALDEQLRLPHEQTTTLFRIAQEAINNIVRHAGASNVILGLEKQDDSVCLRVEDDGCGFDYTRQPEQMINRQQWGLLGIQERAELVGGQVTIFSQPGHGTRLMVSVPLPS